MMKKVIYAILAIIIFASGKLLLKADYAAFLQWWLAVAVIGIVFLPLTSLIFSGFHDKGYVFSKAIGIAVTGYIMWLLSSLHILKFTVVSCIISVIVGLALNCIILIISSKYGKKRGQGNSFGLTRFLLKERVFDTVLAEELLFLALFLLFAYVRAFKPEAYGTEKFMDYGFMTSMMRSDYMPPQDFWFSGTNLNYYYVGQYLATFLTKLSFVKVTSGYNLMLMLVGAFAAVLPYSLVYNIALQFRKEREKKGKLIPMLSGAIGAAAVCIAGNMHYPIYRWLEPLVRKFFGMEASTDKYWFPDATRFIGYHPETNDKTIHEFPSYSFVLGDLHAHVINIMFVLTVLGILFAWMCARRARRGEKLPLWREVVSPATLLLSFFIGLFHTTNFWDFPIYYVVSGAVILFTNMVVYNFKGKAVLAVTAFQGIFILAASKIVSLPFTLNFNQISTTPRLCVAHTPLNQLIILWGLPIFMVIAFLCFMVSDFLKSRKANPDVEQKRRKPFLAQLFEALSGPDLFILAIGLCAIGLVLLPELVYIEDIYSGDYKRANTMFKLTYQAFIMFGISFGYIFLRLLWYGTTKRQKRIAAAGLVLFALTLCYIQNAVNGWYGNIFKLSRYKGLDATEFMETKLPDDMLAIDWLNDNVTGMPVVLEANGDSYTDYERVSVMTGLPTVLGWRTHEWLWKSDTSILDARAADIERIYTSTDETEVRNLLEKYNVSYIYVGGLEREKFPLINNGLLKSLGQIVFLSPVSDTKDYETYIVEIEY
jgi:YYY domain-containing protein